MIHIKPHRIAKVGFITLLFCSMAIVGMLCRYKLCREWLDWYCYVSTTYATLLFITFFLISILFGGPTRFSPHRVF